VTSSELKYGYKRNNPEGYFFDRKTMNFFGDTMGNFGVRDGGKVKTLDDDYGVVEIEVWDLYRKKPCGCSGLHGHCRYFAKDDFREIFTVSV